MELKDLFKEHADMVEERLKELVGKEELREVKSRLDSVEQKAARKLGPDYGTEHKSWGEQFVDSDGLKDFAAETTRPGRYRMDVKTTVTTATGSGGDLIPTTRDNTVTGLPQRRMTVRDLLPVIGISTGQVEYPRQTSRTNNAAMVAEGDLKPESALAFELDTETARVIAHWIPASRQVLDDAPQLRGLIDTELLYGLALKEEEQLLYGSGTGQNLNGMVTQATAYTAPFDPAGTETMIDMVALGMLQNALAEEPATGIIVHPSDWLRMRLLKDADGKYLLGDPGSNVASVLFGLPVVQTQAMTVDKFLIGNFPRAATLYDRWAPRVEVSTEHADFFTRNLVAILAEERIALAVKRPTALTYGDFGNVA